MLVAHVAVKSIPYVGPAGPRATRIDQSLPGMHPRLHVNTLPAGAVRAANV